MANNPYVNKVQLADGTTVIDITDTTATASDVKVGTYFHDATGELVEGEMTGGTPAVAVTEEADIGGGVIKNITALDISDTTAIASDVAQGKYFYTASGIKTAGTGSGGSGNWNWMGKNPTRVKAYVDSKVYLKDSPFASWTPTTTETTLTSTTNLESYTASLDKDYVLVFRWHSHFEYAPNTERKSIINDGYAVQTYIVQGYSSTYANFIAGTKNAIRNATQFKWAALMFVNSSGNNNYNAALSYGIYPDYQSPSISSPSVTPKTPNIKALCSNSYFSTASASAVDLNSSYYEQTIELWAVDSGTSFVGAVLDDVYDMYSNGF